MAGLAIADGDATKEGEGVETDPNANGAESSP
jgi:hypothetical protein